MRGERRGRVGKRGWSECEKGGERRGEEILGKFQREAKEGIRRIRKKGGERKAKEKDTRIDGEKRRENGAAAVVRLLLWRCRRRGRSGDVNR